MLTRLTVLALLVTAVPSVAFSQQPASSGLPDLRGRRVTVTTKDGRYATDIVASQDEDELRIGRRPTVIHMSDVRTIDLINKTGSGAVRGAAVGLLVGGAVGGAISHTNKGAITTGLIVGVWWGSFANYLEASGGAVRTVETRWHVDATGAAHVAEPLTMSSRFPNLVGRLVTLSLADGRAIKGRVRYQSNTELTVIWDGIKTVEVSDVQSIDVVDGVSDGVFKGLVVGAAAGNLLGKVASGSDAVDGNQTRTPNESLAVSGRVASTIVGGAVGALVGMLLDARHDEVTRVTARTTTTTIVSPMLTLHSAGVAGVVRW